MAVTPSTKVELGIPCPDFELEDVVSGRTTRRTDFESRPLLVTFICNHCPFVQHVREKLVEVAHEFMDKGIGVVAINSNSIETHPQDGPEHMRSLAISEGWRFPFCFDSTQEVAKAFRAACTPDFFLYDGEHRLYYHGQMDSSRPGNDVPVTGEDLKQAVEALLDGREPPKEQKPSIGCNIKWKPGNEPDYFG